jgi:hypothetical protein
VLCKIFAISESFMFYVCELKSASIMRLMSKTVIDICSHSSSAILFVDPVETRSVLKCKSAMDTHYGLCGLVARVPGYRSRGPGSISGATGFSENSGSGTESIQPREYN